MTFARFDLILAAVVFALGTGPALAAPGSLLTQCWSQADLAAQPGERRIVKLNGAPDTKPVQRELLMTEPTPEALQGSIRSIRIADGQKLIALTFDLCESRSQIAGYDGDIVDTLRKLGVKATFFAGGKWLLDHPERSEQLMADANVELGNHNWSHANVRRIDAAGIAREIGRTQAAYEQLREQFGQAQCTMAQPASFSRIPKRLELYRFPYGACNAAGLKAVADQGLVEIQWDIAMGDPDAAQTAEMIVKDVMRKVHPGAIIIGHANGRGVNTNEALLTLIPLLKSKGYEFVTVNELMAAGTPVIAQECYSEKPGDLDRYDKPKDETAAAQDRKAPNDANGAALAAPVVAVKAAADFGAQSAVKPRARKRSKSAPAEGDWFGLFGSGSG